MDGPLLGQAWRKREYERTQRRGVQCPLRGRRKKGRVVKRGWRGERVREKERQSGERERKRRDKGKEGDRHSQIE